MKKILSSILIFCTVFLLATGTCLAASSKKTPTDRPVKTSEAEANLPDLQKVMQAESYSEALQWNDLDGEAEAYISGAYSKETLMFLLNTGRMLGYLDDFKAAGIVDQNYTSPYMSDNKNSTQQVATQKVEEILTEKCDEKNMWAKSQVNVRENGSTDYGKVGSLQANEQVTVTGIDSTGWYEIRKADGTVGHVSEKYLTEEEPSSNAAPEEEANEETPKRESEIISIDGRTVVWYNAETEKEEEFVFGENIPLEEVEDLAVKHLVNGEEMVEPEKTEEVEETEAAEVIAEPVPVETSEEIKEELVQEEPAETEELEVSEPQEKADETQGEMQTPIIVFVCVLVGLIVVAGIVVMMKAKKKE